ncbi:hypothetical protein DYH52_02650 [Morganella morganii]|uniref:hypothetical protein n=1 Tax=Morganella morganii TaxID=582 RepID=UPI000E24C7B6|nr:hypothetical protein [Morganella morganii]REL20499.1 hypothetical protein DYH52_02650 [Morganella morganii]
MRDFFANLFKCTSETMIERVKNPIVGSFIFSWLFFNWKVILILLFGDKEIDDKINSISALISYKSFLFPLVFAFLYSWLLPAFSLGIDILLKPIVIRALKIRTDREVTEYESRETTGKKKADAELAYELQKTGGLEKIQRMQEEITASKDREGVLAQERDEAIDEKNKINKENVILRKKYLDAVNEVKVIQNKIPKKERDKNVLNSVQAFYNNDFDGVSGSKYTIINNIIELLGLDFHSHLSDINNKQREIIESSLGIGDINEVIINDLNIFDFLRDFNVEQLSFLESNLI